MSVVPRNSAGQLEGALRLPVRDPHPGVLDEAPGDAYLLGVGTTAGREVREPVEREDVRRAERPGQLRLFPHPPDQTQMSTDQRELVVQAHPWGPSGRVSSASSHDWAQVIAIAVIWSEARTARRSSIAPVGRSPPAALLGRARRRSRPAHRG